MNFTPQELTEKFATLPPEVRRAILDVNLDEKVKDIGINHDLHIDAVGTLMTEIILVIIGLNKADNFKNELVGKLGIPDEKLDALVEEVNQKVFMGIRELMKRQPEEEIEEEATPQIEPLKETPILIEEKLDSVASNMQNAQTFSSMPTVATHQEQKPAGMDLDLDRDKLLDGIENVSMSNTPVFNFSKDAKKEEPVAPVVAPAPQAQVEPKIIDPANQKPTSIFESKMMGEFSMPQAKTDASIPNITPEIKKVDSYREPIE